MSPRILGKFAKPRKIPRWLSAVTTVFSLWIPGKQNKLPAL
jgi:hypothetical protein